MLRTPAFVDTMEVADDADGRVAIFSVEDAPIGSPGSRSAPELGHPPHRGAARSLGKALDSRLAPALLAAVLVLILVLGLMLTRH